MKEERKRRNNRLMSESRKKILLRLPFIPLIVNPLQDEDEVRGEILLSLSLSA